MAATCQASSLSHSTRVIQKTKTNKKKTLKKCLSIFSSQKQQQQKTNKTKSQRIPELLTISKKKKKKKKKTGLPSGLFIWNNFNQSVSRQLLFACHPWRFKWNFSPVSYPVDTLQTQTAVFHFSGSIFESCTLVESFSCLFL